MYIEISFMSVGVCAGERERQYMRKTMAQRRENAFFSASSATKRGLTNIARPSSAAQRASLRHTAAGIPQGGGGVCGGGGEVAGWLG